MNIFKLVVCSFVFLLVSSSVSGRSSAQGVNDFLFESFEVSMKLSNDDPQGTLQISETMRVDFSGQNRGIERAVPLTYGEDKTSPKVIDVTRDGVKEPYITYHSGDNLVIRIGDPDVYITGKHTYELIYQVENVIRFYENHDELYWDINGTGWRQPFITVGGEVASRATVMAGMTPQCFTGSFGQTGSNCEINAQADTVRFSTTEQLDAGKTLTVLVAYQKGYFTPPSWWELNYQYVLGASFATLQGTVLWFAFKRWRKLGKDYDSRPVPPYFERPQKVSLLEASYVSENTLKPKHVSGAIIDLAVRGYIKILESKDKKPKHTLVLQKVIDNELAVEERTLLEKIFESYDVGATVTLEDKKNKLHSVLTNLKSQLDTSTANKGYYEISPIRGPYSLTKYMIIAIVMLVIAFLTMSITRAIPVIAGIIVLLGIIVLGQLMAKRSRSGQYLKEHMEGLKKYLSLAQKDRMAAHDAVAAPLSPLSSEPVRDVTFFEKLLPFAVAMGVEKTWAKAFQDIYQQPPEWYQGNWNTFSTTALASSISSTSKVASSSFTQPASSGSSGYSGGGGFSGGGGGGGGGGGW